MVKSLNSIQLGADAKSFCKGQFQETLSGELKRKEKKHYDITPSLKSHFSELQASSS